MVPGIELPNNLKFVVCEPDRLGPEIREKLEEAGTVSYGPFATSNDLLVALAEADVLFVRLRHQIDRKTLDAAPRLKMIISATTGLNHIDVSTCSERAIEIVCLRGDRDFLSQITSTSEMSFALLLSLARRLPAAHGSVLAGQWDRDAFFGLSLSGMVLGIIGFGRLGSAMARYAKAFSMKVIAFDRTDVAPSPDVDEFVSLPTLIAQSDAIAIHATHFPGEPPILGAAEIAAMKPSVLIVNTARGELVDEECLVAALSEGRVGGYGTDVLSNEQSIRQFGQHPLVRLARKMDNVLLTPHIGGATNNGLAMTENHVVDKAMARLADRELL